MVPRTHELRFGHALPRRRDVEVATVRALAGAPSLRDAAPRILEGICHALDWDFGAIWTLDDPKNILRCQNVWMRNREGFAAFAALCLELELKRGQGLPGRVWEAGSPVWMSDVSVDDNFPRGAAAGEAGLHGAFAFPIFVRREFFGVIEFFTRKTREPDAHGAGLSAAEG